MKPWFILALCLSLLIGCSPSESTNESNVLEKAKEKLRASGWTKPEVSTNETMDVVKELYRQAKEKGEDVPGDALEWAKTDIKKIGAWQYRVERLPTDDPQALTVALNELGAQRWECFWVEKTSEDTLFYFKKSGRSYLRIIPTGDLLKLIPQGGGETAAE